MKTKLFKKTIVAALAAAMLPVIPAGVSAAETPELIVNESFNDMVTNAAATDLEVSARNTYVTEYAEKEKGLLLYADAGSSFITIPMSNSADIVVSFDIQAVDGIPGGEVSVSNAGGISQTLLKFTEDGGAGAYNGYPVNGFGTAKMRNYTVVYSSTKKKTDVYVDGKQVVSNMKIKTPKVAKISELRFAFQSEGGTKGVIIDNLNVYAASEKVYNSYPVAAYNAEAEVENDMTFGEQIGNRVLANYDFETTSLPSINANSNTFEVIEDSGNPENHVLHIERLVTSDAHVNATGVGSDSDSVVYEFDFRPLTKDTAFAITLKDDAEQFNNLGSIGIGPEFTPYNGAAKSLSIGKWYRASFIVDYFNRKFDVYLDGELIATKDMADGFASNGAKGSIFRIHMTHYAVSSVKAKDTDDVKMDVDNFRVYEGKELLDELGDIKKEIDLASTKKSVFKSDAAYKTMLDGYTAVHGTSGVVFKDGEKSILSNLPYDKDGEQMVPAKELAEKLGYSVSENGTTATVNDKSISGEIKDGVLYVNIKDFVQASGKVATNIPSTYNAHMYVLGSTSFAIPDSQATIDSLNDYVLYLRPTSAQVTEIYNASPNNGQHPRLHVNAADVADIKSRVQTDTQMKIWSEKVIASADSIIPLSTVVHEKYDGLRMNCQREMQSRMYTLGMAYLLTGDTKYSERAYLDLEAVAKFPDWNPGHHLDTCEMMQAVAVGYDWMYNAFTEEQRAVIEQGMMNNGFYDSWMAMQTESTAMANAFTATNNHGVVDNGGLAMAALAFFDVYPEESAYLLSNAIRGMDLSVWQYAPYGSWYEGASYWVLNTEGTVRYIDSLQTALGTDLGFANLQGMKYSLDAALQLQTPLSIFTYYDSYRKSSVCGEMFWLADQYDIEGGNQSILDFTGGTFTEYGNALALMWYKPKTDESSTSAALDYFLEEDGTAVWRNSWESQEPTAVFMKGGYTNPDHGQLGNGNFVFESNGIRWADDTGMGNYNCAGYWERATGGARWNHFDNRAEAHNVIVLDPTDKEDQVVESNSYMTLVQSKPRGSIMTSDLNEVYGDKVTAYKRGYMFTDNRQSLVVRDEMTLTGNSEGYWFMMTEENVDVTVNGNTAVLTKDGKSCTLEIVASVDGTLSAGPAKPLSTSPVCETCPDRTTRTRIMFKFNGSGNVNVTAKLTPGSAVNTTSVNDYNTDIANWNVPDGEMPKAPSVDAIVVNGEKITTNKKTSVEFTCVEGEFTTPPAPSVESDEYYVEVKPASSFNESATVTLTDKNDSYNKTVYTITYAQIKAPITFEGRTSIPVRKYSVSEVPQPENAAINLFDGDRSTRWSAEGFGQWILVDLGSVQRVDDIALAFFSGHTRSTKLVIEVSEDGEIFETVFDGLSSGKTEEHEFFSLQGKNARYIKVNCNGNTAGGGESWNSVTELVVTRNN